MSEDKESMQFILNHVPNSGLYQEKMMKRCYSNLSLPQAVIRPAKRNLVKTVRSDGESNRKDLNNFDDQCQPKKLRLNKLLHSFEDFDFERDDAMSPSEGSLHNSHQNIVRVPSQDDLWASIKSNYTFLMADDLIEECKETREELHLLHIPSIPSYSSPSSQQILTISEFKERFNRLHDNLHSIQISSSRELKNEEQIKELSSEYHLLKQQAAILKLMDIDMTEDIDRRINILSNKWELLERILHPQRTKERDGVIKNLAVQMKDIRKWLREVEEKLRKLKFNHDCDAKEINDIFNKQKILQKEIEGCGKELTSLVRQCVSLEGATTADSKRLRRAATHLERSWHNIWIRSLEKQCLTEQRLLQHQNNDTKSQDSSDIDTDEGPLVKHRRLALDRWTAVRTIGTMDRTRHVRDSRNSSDILKKSPTRDVGVLCSDLVPVNDKCIMVGTTGIAALKAEYGDDFTNFEIIQDVGYSSESSTHLFSDDGIGIGGDRYFNIRIYKYLDDKSAKTSMSLKEELENACAKQFRSLSSSVDSSSGGTSFNDSGIGNTDTPAGEDVSEVSKEHSSVDEQLHHCEEDFSNEEAGLPGDESDYLETVLASCSSFNEDNGKRYKTFPDDLDELPFSLSGIDSDDAGCNFQDRTSFTKPAQVFYKMISVDSDNGENELRENSTNIPSTNFSSHCDTFQNSIHNDTQNSHKYSHSDKVLSFSENVNFTFPPKRQSQRQQKMLRTSTPLHKSCCSSTALDHSNHQNLKRKRNNDSTSATFVWESTGLPPSQVRSWLKRCSMYSDEPQRISKRSLFRFEGSTSGNQESSEEHEPVSQCFNPYDDISSCDASGEYTSSSADEGNILSSSPSYIEDTFYTKERLDSYSMEGSVETVIRNLSTSFRTDSDTLDLSPSASLSHLTSPANLLRDQESKSKPIRNCNEEDYHSSTVSCEETRLTTGKALSDSDLRVLSVLSISHNRLDKGISQKFDSNSHPRLHSSLPSVLYHRSGSSTEDANGSAALSDTRRSQYSLDQGRKSCPTFSQNLSSSSEFGKRKRRRKKSSSSARSSRSALNGSDSGRQRSRTLTNSVAGYGGKVRHYSQQSIFLESSENNFFSEDDGSLSEVKISRTDDLVRKNLNEDFVRTLDDSCNECISSKIPSPVESDVILTHLEEQSTVSDQVWDGYQEMPYLSEGYSEATVDEDAVRKLTEFGDDYGSALKFIDASDTKLSKGDAPKSPKKSSKSLLTNHIQRLSSFSNDSDSDTEDLHHVIEEARKALQFARATLRKGQSDVFFTSSEYAELLATCGTHLRCLQTICEHIENDKHGNSFSVADLNKLHHLIEEWELLKKSVEMSTEGEDYIKQKYVKARKNIDALLQTMSEWSAFADVEVESFVSWEELKEKVSQLQMVMTKLQGQKEQLIAVNLEVHRFMTDHGCGVDYKNCSLKENITELYQQWEDIYENNEKQLTALEIVCNNWKVFNDKFRALRYNVKFVENLSPDNSCDNTCLTSDKEEIGSLTRNLLDLQKDAVLLKEFLKGGATWKSIDLELQDLAERINKYTRTQQTSRSIEHPLSKQEKDPDDQFEDAMQLLEVNNYGPSLYNKSCGEAGPKKDPSWVPKRKPSRFWRMIRVAVPVQLALVFLYCLACCLEPNCCDMLNNFNFSLSPHLRYFRGPPPA